MWFGMADCVYTTPFNRATLCRHACVVRHGSVVFIPHNYYSHAILPRVPKVMRGHHTTVDLSMGTPFLMDLGTRPTNLGVPISM